MKAFKYRSGSKRDLEGLENNYLFVPHPFDLNDPTENLFDESRLLNFINQLEKNHPTIKSKMKSHISDSCSKLREDIGIFSLSKTESDELLWAYYADSHSGFCIEYDLDRLQELNKNNVRAIFDVIYQKEIPYFDENTSIEPSQIKEILQLTHGTKSEKWKHEKEIRICIEYLKKSKKFDYDYRAVTAIYFGLKMPKNNSELDENNHNLPFRYSKVSQNEIMRALQGRGIKYFQMYLKPNSYNFGYSEVEDLYKSSTAYKKKVLGEVPVAFIDYCDYGNKIAPLYFDKVSEIIRRDSYYHHIYCIHLSKEESTYRGEPIIYAGFYNSEDEAFLISKYFTLQEIDEQYSALNISKE